MNSDSPTVIDRLEEVLDDILSNLPEEVKEEAKRAAKAMKKDCKHECIVTLYAPLTSTQKWLERFSVIDLPLTIKCWRLFDIKVMQEPRFYLLTMSGQLCYTKLLPRMEKAEEAFPAAFWSDETEIMGTVLNVLQRRAPLRHPKI